MPVPRLIHPVPIEIRPLLRTQTVVDIDYREPTGRPAYARPVSVPGQVHWTIDERLRETLYGQTREASGYATFRRIDLRAVGIEELREGDRITAVGVGPNRIEIDCYVVGVRNVAHYPDQGGPTLSRTFFADRAPAKQSMRM